MSRSAFQIHDFTLRPTKPPEVEACHPPPAREGASCGDGAEEFEKKRDTCCGKCSAPVEPGTREFMMVSGSAERDARGRELRSTHAAGAHAM